MSLMDGSPSARLRTAVDSDAQLALDNIRTADDEVEILNASEELHKGWISVKKEWLGKRSVKGKNAKKKAQRNEWRRRD